MTGTLLNLEAERHQSRVLGAWLAERAGAAERAGVTTVLAAAENSHESGLTSNHLASIFGMASTSSAGIAVTPDTAMRVSTVYACVSLLAGAIASLPVGVFERAGRVRREVDHDYWWMLNEQANEDMTSAAAWEYMITAKSFHGDGFAELLRPSRVSNRVIGWLPHHPLRVQPFRDTDGTKYYRVYPEIGASYVLDSADMIQIPSLGYDGLTSPSPITHAAREVIGAALAGDAYTGRFFNDGGNFDYALKTATKVDEEQLKLLQASLRARQGGPGSRSPLILTGGLEPAQLSVNSKDAEILATRMFGVEQICAILGVPPHMIGRTEKASSWGTGMAEQGGNFVRYTLRRHLTPIAQELNRKFWPTHQRYFVAHKTEALESGDMKSRADGWRTALGRAGEPGWMTVDEVRRAENLPPIAGGDQLFNGAEDASANTAGEQQEAA